MTVYRQNTNIEKIGMRASGTSELRKFSHFYILKLLFFSIFCRYFRYFVGTNDMLVGLHVPTNFQMYRQNSEKALLGGNCPPAPPPPPPPSGYANGPYSKCAANCCNNVSPHERRLFILRRDYNIYISLYIPLTFLDCDVISRRVYSPDTILVVLLAVIKDCNLMYWLKAFFLPPSHFIYSCTFTIIQLSLP